MKFARREICNSSAFKCLCICYFTTKGDSRIIRRSMIAIPSVWSRNTLEPLQITLAVFEV